MTAVMTPELLGEYENLTTERMALGRALHTGDATADTHPRYDAVMRRLRELAALPPAGHALPKQAADLLAFAEAHGWLTLVQWSRHTDEPSVDIQIGRTLLPGEMPDARGTAWHYRLVWHSRGCAPGRLRLFGRCLATTPDRPATHEGPSLRGIRAVIDQYPAPTREAE